MYKYVYICICIYTYINTVMPARPSVECAILFFWFGLDCCRRWDPHTHTHTYTHTQQEITCCRRWDQLRSPTRHSKTLSRKRKAKKRNEFSATPHPLSRPLSRSVLKHSIRASLVLARILLTFLFFNFFFLDMFCKDVLGFDYVESASARVWYLWFFIFFCNIFFMNASKT